MPPHSASRRLELVDGQSSRLQSEAGVTEGPAIPVQHERSTSRPVGAAFCGVASVGCALAVWLAVLHHRAHAGDAGASFCAIDSRLDCDAIALSPSSVFMGAPVAVWGLLGYAVMAALAVTGVTSRRLHPGWPAGILLCLTTGSVAVSMRLAWISEVQIRSLCLLCIACWTVNALLAALAWWMARRHGGPRLCVRDDLRALRDSPLAAGAAVATVALTALSIATRYPAYWTTIP